MGNTCKSAAKENVADAQDESRSDVANGLAKPDSRPDGVTTIQIVCGNAMPNMDVGR